MSMSSGLNIAIILGLYLLVFVCVLTSASDAPKITTSPQKTTVIQNQSLYLFCRVSGNPSPTIKWLKGNRILKNDKKKKINYRIISFPFGSVLFFKKASLSLNNKKFSCRATNDVGRNSSKAVTVNVLKKDRIPDGFPELKESPQIKVSEKGGRATMKCRANGNDTVDIFWTKDMIPIDMSNSRFTIKHKGTLEIEKSVEKDMGLYTCHATNEFGSTSGSAMLYIKARKVPPRFIIYTNTTEINPGENVTLKCVAMGHPLPTITFMNGAALLTNSKMIGKGELLVRELRASTNYTCKAKSQLGTIKQLIQVIVRELPPPPRNLIVSEVRANSVRLTWTPFKPSDSNFTVFYRIENSPKMSTCTPSTCKSNIRDQTAVISRLRVNTAYLFSICTVNAIGRGRPSQPVREITGQTAPSSAPLNIRAKAVNDNSITISWDEPTETNGNIMKYHVRYALNDLSEDINEMNLWTLKTVSGEFRSLNIDSLLIGRIYTIRVSAENGIGLGPYSEKVKVTTKVGTPEKPENFKGEAISASAIRISWDSSKDPSIKHYFLYYNTTRRTYQRIKIDSSLKEYELNKLEPNTIYHLSLSSVATAESQKTDTIQLKTFQYGNVGRPRNVKVTKIRDRHDALIKVIWSASADPSIIGYQISCIELSTGRLKTANPIIIDVGRSRKGHIIRQLQYFTNYKVKVRAKIANDYGPWSSAVYIKTEGSVPGKPLGIYLTVINSTALRVFWKAPSKSNGEIMGYNIEHSEVKLNRHGRPSVDSYRHHSIHIMNFTIVNLKPDTMYKVQVIAFNQKGDGELSDPKEVQTKKPVPSKPNNLELKIDSSDPPSILVTWSKPLHLYGTFKEYKLTYSKALDPDYITISIVLGVKTHTIENLDYGTLYEVRVYAKNQIGFGVYAVKEIQTPDGVPTGQPKNFHLMQLTSESVRLIWEPPSVADRRGKIITYQIRYNMLEESELLEVNSTNLEKEIDMLQLGKNYVFQIRAFTSKGAGPWSDRYPHIMVYKHPATPTDVKAIRKTENTMEVSWNQARTSEVKSYNIFYTENPKTDRSKWLNMQTGPYTSVDVELPDTNVYYVKVQAVLFSDQTTGFSEIVQTGNLLPDDPEMVSLFRSTTQNPMSVGLSWRAPAKGTVTQYNITYRGKNSFKQHGLYNTNIDPLKSISVPGNENSVHITGLKSAMKYTFEIRAVFRNGRIGAKVLLITKTSFSSIFNVPKIISTQDHFVHLNLVPAMSLEGNFKWFDIIVVPASISDKIPDSNQWKYSQILRKANNDLPWIAYRFKSKLPEKFILGNTKNLHDNDINNDFANNALPTNVKYKLFIRAYISPNNYKSTSYSKIFTASNTSQSKSFWMSIIGLIIIACIGVFFVLIILVLFIVMTRKKSNNRASADRKMLNATGNNELTASLLKMAPIRNETQHTPVLIQDPVLLRRTEHETQAMINHPPILVSDLVDHVENLKANDGAGFSEEYESIEPGQQFTWENSNLDANKANNRYANVIAYDHSRVCLQINEDDDTKSTDYINANYMDGYRKHNAYIATQGPLPETFVDFWRMIWQQRTCSIVMMTKLEERQRVKCDQYWPTRGQEVYGRISVSLVDVIELSTYTIRTFKIQKDNSQEKREVRQFQFTAWPDHGLPSHPTPLLLFMRRVKAITPSDSGPMVIHCSAGVGRTGTFIVIDASLERIKHERSVDVYGHVTCLRAQRNYMVQTEDQYVFIHDALLEAITSGNTEIMACNLYTHIEKLNTIEPGETATPLEMEFKSLTNLRLSSTRAISGNLPVNKCKNRLLNIVPYESTRVSLCQIRGVDGSDYINASFIDGYRYRNAYIATQGPMAETTEDFWRLLWEHNSTIIIMLTKLYENGREKCHQYWPSERSARYQYFVVDPMSEYNMPQYILREFKVTDARDGQSKTIRQFQFTDWPEPQSVPSSGEGFIEFIGQVHKTKEQFGQDGPITVHCSAGVGRTGVFTALSIVLERMRYEGVVDMYQTVKMLRTQRPAMVQTEEQYGFCYRAALEYLGSFDQYN